MGPQTCRLAVSLNSFHRTRVATWRMCAPQSAACPILPLHTVDPPGRNPIRPPLPSMSPSCCSAPSHLASGIWSQVKRAPKANRKRKTFEVAGPGAAGAISMDERARQNFQYFKSYNYKVRRACAPPGASGHMRRWLMSHASPLCMQECPWCTLHGLVKLRVQQA